MPTSRRRRVAFTSLPRFCERARRSSLHVSGPSRTKPLGDRRMSVVETERHGQVLVVRMNRPERLNALNGEMRAALAETWTEFRRSKELEVAIFTTRARRQERPDGIARRLRRKAQAQLQ